MAIVPVPPLGEDGNHIMMVVVRKMTETSTT